MRRQDIKVGEAYAVGTGQLSVRYVPDWWRKALVTEVTRRPGSTYVVTDRGSYQARDVRMPWAEYQTLLELYREERRALAAGREERVRLVGEAFRSLGIPIDADPDRRLWGVSGQNMAWVDADTLLAAAAKTVAPTP